MKYLALGFSGWNDYNILELDLGSTDEVFRDKFNTLINVLLLLYQSYIEKELTFVGQNKRVIMNLKHRGEKFKNQEAALMVW